MNDRNQSAEARTPGPALYALACADQVVRGRRLPPIPAHPLYERRAACFVTLKKRGELRGCIGTLSPAETSLGREIGRNARAAAFDDPRFPPVRADELESLECSVDILGPSRPCELDDLDPARYGVIVRAGLRRGVLLPDLAGVDTVARQVGIALQKAGISPEQPFHVERFRVTRCHAHDSADDILAALAHLEEDPPIVSEADA